ncbi:DUF7284 family protein [Halorussus litoreus]|uniref:DUF7284 family protein n=1 Tax=Halorussus litoreus TaxID=1710536 RepID=UPI0013004934|nr:hypothetical protein [Halorussus litoreus]
MRENSARGVSTLLDATLCLLLVSASAMTLASALHESESEQELDAESADQTAELLTTSTARVTYSAGDRTRTAHDTLAGLLASAVRTDVRAAAPGEPTTANSTFVEAVAQRLNRTLRRTEASVEVVARWPVGRNATTESGIVVGDRPPRDAAVHAAGFVAREVRFTVRTWSATRQREATESRFRTGSQGWSA